MTPSDFVPIRGLRAILDEFPDRPSWRGAHKGKLGSTSLSAILGVSHHSTPFYEYQRLVGAAPDDRFHGDPPLEVRRGEILEGPAAELLALEQKTLVLPLAPSPYWMATHETIPWLVATPDRFCVDQADLVADGDVTVAPVEKVRLAEIKCPTKFGALKWKEAPPEHVIIQSHAHMIVCQGPPGVVISPLIFGGNEPFFLARDNTVQAQLLQYAQDFMAEYVEKRVPPRPGGDDLDLLKMIFGAPTREIVKLTEHAAQCAREYKKWSAEEGAAKKKKKNAKAELIAEMNGAYAGESEGVSVKRVDVSVPARWQEGYSYWFPNVTVKEA